MWTERLVGATMGTIGNALETNVRGRDGGVGDVGFTYQTKAVMISPSGARETKVAAKLGLSSASGLFLTSCSLSMVPSDHGRDLMAFQNHWRRHRAMDAAKRILAAYEMALPPAKYH